MQNSPVVSCNAVSLCETLSNVRSTTVQMDGDQTMSYRGVGNGQVVGSTVCQAVVVAGRNRSRM